MDIALSGTDVASDDGVLMLVDACRELDLHAVDLWYPKNTDPVGVERTLKDLDANGIRVTSIGTATEVGGDRDCTRDQAVITEAVDLAARIGCPTVNTYFGYLAERDDERAIARYARNVAECVAHAAARGVTITIENEFDGFGIDAVGSDVTRRPASVRALLDAVGSPAFRATFDACNAYFAGVDPLTELFPVVRGDVASVHVKDGRGIADDAPAAPGWKRFSDEGRAYTTCDLGDGDVDWPSIVREVVASGYTGTWVLEPHCEPAALPEAWRTAATRLREWLAAAR